MTLIERLRSPLKHPQECVNQRQEAATEIERLQHELDAAERYAEDMHLKLNIYRAKEYLDNRKVPEIKFHYREE